MRNDGEPRFGDDAADWLSRGHQVIVGQVGIVGSGGVAPVSEELARQRQVLAGHDGVAGHSVAEVVEPCPADASVGADGKPAVSKPARADRVGGEYGKMSSSALRLPGNASRSADGGAQRHGARTALGVGEVDGVRADVAPS